MLRETPSMRRIVVVVGVDPSPSQDSQSSYWTSGFAMDLVVENDTDDWSAKGYDGNATFTRSELVHWSGKQFFQRSQIFGEGFIHMIVDTDSRTESRLAGDRGTFTARLFVEHSPYLMGRMLVDFLTSLLRELLRKQKQWYSRIKEKTRWRPESGDREAFAAIALLPPWRSYRIWELDWDTHDKEILATAALDTAGSQPLWRVYVDRVRFHDNDQLLGQKDFGRFCREAKDLDIAPIITYWMEARRLAQIHESRLYQT
ncbi:hypothetical protein A0H81_10548 [Grifola frondosa]|uniref:Uncharacterized protein n=1 Tax=Grifola frondosa TaxID=5627 RepID=A0A1C7M3Y6_GRIFR|nr:hypothetical protein A0H81_10548 [Grifola frondosa]